MTSASKEQNSNSSF